MHLAIARFARISGAEVADGDDAGPMRVDGRADRHVRWVDGVAVVTDGRSLLSVRGLEAAQEWLFMIPRPALVIADGPYADVALDAGIEVIAFAGLDHCSLALGAARTRRCTGRADVDRPGARRLPPVARAGPRDTLTSGVLSRRRTPDSECDYSLASLVDPRQLVSQRRTLARSGWSRGVTAWAMD